MVFAGRLLAVGACLQVGLLAAASAEVEPACPAGSADCLQSDDSSLLATPSHKKVQSYLTQSRANRTKREHVLFCEADEITVGSCTAPDECDEADPLGSPGAWHESVFGGVDGMTCKVTCGKDPNGLCHYGSKDTCSKGGKCKSVDILPPPGMCITGFCMKGLDTAKASIGAHDCFYQDDGCFPPGQKVSISGHLFGANKLPIKEFVVKWRACDQCGSP